MALYYVDSTVPGPGTGAIGDPWDDINSNLSTLVAGDTMYLRGGANPAARQDYNETLAITAANGCANGSSGSEITIANYADEYVRLYSASSVELFTIERDYWTIEGQAFDVDSGDPYFEVDRNGVGDYAVRIGAFNSNADNNTLRYLHIHNGDYNPALVRIRNSSDNLVSYCRIHDNVPQPHTDHHGIYVSSNDSGTPSDDNVIEYCRIYDCAGDCVQIQTSSTGTVSGTIVRHCTLIGHSTPGAGETAVADKNGSGTTVHNCTMYGFRDCDGSIGGSGGDGYAMRFQTASSGALVYDNEIYDCSGAAIVVDGTSAVFHHNLVRDPTYEASIANKIVACYVTGGGELELYNNTVVGTLGAGTYNIRLLVAGTLDVRNNIFKDTEDLRDDGGTLSYDYDCWWNANQTWAGAHDVNDNPDFTNEGADDFTLQAVSPCIDAGVDLGYPYLGSDPDMGAFEYNPGAGAVVHVTVVVTVTVAIV